MGTVAFRWITLVGAVTASLAASTAGARPTPVPPGPEVRPGEVVTIGRWRDGLYVGPRPAGNIDKIINANLLSTLRVRGNLIEEFRISLTITCQNNERVGDVGQKRRFLSSHASLQTMLRIGTNGTAQARFPMTDSFRWMNVWAKIDFLGDKAKVSVRANSMRDPNSRDPLVEECVGVGDIEVHHTPATPQTGPALPWE